MRERFVFEFWYEHRTMPLDILFKYISNIYEIELAELTKLMGEFSKMTEREQTNHYIECLITDIHYYKKLPSGSSVVLLLNSKMREAFDTIRVLDKEDETQS